MEVKFDKNNFFRNSGNSNLKNMSLETSKIDLGPIDIAVRKLWLKIFKMYNAIALNRKASFSLGLVLLSIDKDGTPSTQLGPRMGMEPTSLSRQLKMMEELGMITRIPDKKDKRVVNVILTVKGVAARREARDVVLSYNAMLYESIPKEDIDCMLRTLARINDLTD